MSFNGSRIDLSAKPQRSPAALSQGGAFEVRKNVLNLDHYPPVSGGSHMNGPRLGYQNVLTRQPRGWLKAININSISLETGQLSHELC